MPILTISIITIVTFAIYTTLILTARNCIITLRSARALATVLSYLVNSLRVLLERLLRTSALANLLALEVRT